MVERFVHVWWPETRVRRDQETGGPESHTPSRQVEICEPWRWVSKDPVAAVAFSALIALGAVALLAPVISPYSPSAIDLSERGLSPSLQHPLGTDLLGRDVLSRAAFGARISLGVGLGAAFVAALLGLSLGISAGYWGGWRDVIITRLVDASLSVPAFFVLITLQALMGGSAASVVLVVSFVGWMPVARVVRALILSLKQQEFAVAARALGCSEARILFRHLLPNVAPQAGVLYTLGVADALLMESALSFIGFGVPASEPSWGNMLSDAQAVILSGMWWVVAVPGLLILLTALSINVVGDRLSSAGSGVGILE